MEIGLVDGLLMLDLLGRFIGHIINLTKSTNGNTIQDDERTGMLYIRGNGSGGGGIYGATRMKCGVVGEICEKIMLTTGSENNDLVTYTGVDIGSCMERKSATETWGDTTRTKNSGINPNICV